VTVQPGTGRLFITEHGPYVDDEINILRPGANYGWDRRVVAPRKATTRACR
jgi:aldose sugar dehydrogenase